MAGTLNYSINGKDISFSTKSITINGNEFAYKDITAIKHSSAKCVYLFKVDDKWHDVQYDEAHKKTVSILFHRIADLSTRRTNKAAASQTAPAPSKQTETVKPVAVQSEEAAGSEKKHAETKEVKEPAVAKPLFADALQNTVHLSPAQAAEIERALSDVITPEDVNNAKASGDSNEHEAASDNTEAPADTESVNVTESEAPDDAPAADSYNTAEVVDVNAENNNADTGAEASAEKADDKAADESASAGDTAVTDSAVADTITGDAEAEEKSDDKKASPEKHQKFTKSILILAIILACFAVIGIVYYFVIGPADDSSRTFQQDSTHQYNDIEELINEMQ